VTATRTLSVVLPAYDEQRRLPALIAGLERDLPEACAAAGVSLAEILLVDDGSTDGTADAFTRAAAATGIARAIRLTRNRGKGAAVRAGVLEAQGDLVLVTDVDLSTPLAELPRLVAALDAGTAAMAIGSRAGDAARVTVHQPIHRETMGKLFNMMLRALTRLPYRDTQCGFKLLDRRRTRPLFQAQRVDGFAFDAEICVNARRLGLPIAEVAVEWADNRDTRVRLVGSSARMALDLLLIAWRARRPLPRQTAASGEPGA
jgi:glycosyltransferase involved in cell wall biosynthesis